MNKEVVRCPDCREILYVLTVNGCIIGNIVIRHGFTGTCSCGYEFNSQWIKKETEI